MNVQTQNPDGGWREAKPLPADPRVWSDYWEARDRHGHVVAEGTPRRQHRLLTRIFRGWRWRRV